MTFGEALKKLNIEEYSERIFNSNSHGELFHLQDYLALAESLKESDAEWFRPWFVATVELAEKHWSRPSSVFQHIPRLLHESLCQRILDAS